MEDFELTRADAIEETRSQYISQGVNLSNILIMVDGDKSPICILMEQFKTSDELSESSIGELCKALSSLFLKDSASKYYVAGCGGYALFLDIMQRPSVSIASKINLLNLLALLLDGNPDLLDNRGVELLMEWFELAKDNVSLLSACLAFSYSVCLLHEKNRLAVIEASLFLYLDAAFDVLPIKVSRVWLLMVRDDDIRVMCSKAHDNARLIVDNHRAIPRLIKALTDIHASTMLANGHAEAADNSKPSSLICLLSCLAGMCVRNEFCQDAVDCGGLKLAQSILLQPLAPHMAGASSSTESTCKVLTELFRFYAAIAGNDDVRIDIGEICDGIVSLVAKLDQYCSNTFVAKLGCLSLTAITLRNPKNAKQVVVDGGGAGTLVQILKIHKDSSSIMSLCAYCIRNIVSHSEDLISAFIDLDVEVLLREAMETHPSEAQAAKGALRDLGLHVHFKEEWTGVSGIKLDD